MVLYLLSFKDRLEIVLVKESRKHRHYMRIKELLIVPPVLFLLIVDTEFLLAEEQ